MVRRASPLVLDDCTNTALSSTYAIPVQPIDFAQESALLGGLLEETGQCADLVTSFGVTADTLSSGIVQSPTILHLSAHGDFTRNGDFVLALETRKVLPIWFNASVVQTPLWNSPTSNAKTCCSHIMPQ
eukprot:GABV01001340.1.p1 GENE.GABV01001340.1~~GABV01001340.1.p1  ORF type:complete len:129 (+),score=22.25 GABV01001340.1:182-568(+)